MGVQYAKNDENEATHKELMSLVVEIKEDVGYMRGKIDTIEKKDSDWWSRVIAFIALSIAYFKGA